MCDLFGVTQVPSVLCFFMFKGSPSKLFFPTFALFLYFSVCIVVEPKTSVVLKLILSIFFRYIGQTHL